MDWTLSCPDWQDRIRSGRSLVPALPLWTERADKAVRIFNRLRIPDVPGTPTFAQAGGDWFRDIVAALHGALDPATQQRLIRELFVLVPKKNAKTTMGAGLMLTSVLMNERPRAEFLIVAPTQDVANLAFGQAAGMIDLDPTLKKAFHIQSHLKRITYRPTRATLQVKSFDPSVMTGVKPAGILVDEEHVIAEKADADRVMGQIRGGMVSQPEAFLAIITTQSERPPRGVFKADLAACRIGAFC
jgi:phage terminase large subunit-like protein